jgi:hypothetical protein
VPISTSRRPATSRPSSRPRAGADGRTASARQRAGRRACAAEGATPRLPPGARSPTVSRGRLRAQVSSATHALLPPCWRTASVLPAALTRGQEDGADIQPRAVLPHRDRPPVRAQAWMGGQPARGSALAGGHGRLKARRHACRRVRGRPPCRGAVCVRRSLQPPMPSCRRAGARRLSSQPRGRAARRTVPISNLAPSCHIATVLPSARRRGWEDRQRATARWQEGMRG